VREALDGIKNQTYTNLEVLVRDDCSTDSTEAIVRSYVESDDRFHWISDGVNLGSTGNMIELAKRANGEYLKVCNQDDVLLPKCIQRLIKPMMNDPAISLSTSARMLIDGDGRELPMMNFTVPLTDSDQVLDGRTLARTALVETANRIGEPSTVLFRNGLFEPEDLFSWDGHVYQVNNDLALWSKLLLKGNGYSVVAQLSKFRRHGEMRSADINELLTGAIEWSHLFASAIRHNIIVDPNDARVMCQYILLSYNNLNSFLIKKHGDEGAAPYLSRLTVGVQNLQAAMTENAEFMGLSFA